MYDGRSDKNKTKEDLVAFTKGSSAFIADAKWMDEEWNLRHMFIDSIVPHGSLLLLDVSSEVESTREESLDV